MHTADAYGWHCDNIIIFAGFSETGSAARGGPSDGGRAGARGPVAPPNSFPPPPDSRKWGGSTVRSTAATADRCWLPPPLLSSRRSMFYYFYNNNMKIANINNYRFPSGQIRTNILFSVARRPGFITRFWPYFKIHIFMA